MISPQQLLIEFATLVYINKVDFIHQKTDFTEQEQMKNTLDQFSNPVKTAACTGCEMVLQFPDKPQPEALHFELEGRNVKLSHVLQRGNSSSVPPYS